MAASKARFVKPENHLAIGACSGHLINQQKICPHNLRDLKSERYGLGFTASQTRGALRLANLLLIGALALLVLWMIGQAARQQQLDHQYQANTRKHRHVLSLISLG